MWFFKKTALFLLMFLILNSFLSCGYKPLYSLSEERKDINGRLKILKIPGKEGYHLREELTRRLGDENRAAHHLKVKIKTIKMDEVITPNNEITSYRLIMTAIYKIENEDGVTILPNQKSVVRTGFSSSRSSTGYVTKTAEQDAIKRLAVKIGSEISTRLLILSKEWLE